MEIQTTKGPVSLGRLVKELRRFGLDLGPNVNASGNVAATGNVTGVDVTGSGVVSGATVGATGAVTGGTVTGTNGVYDGAYRVSGVKLVSGTVTAQAATDFVLTAYTAYPTLQFVLNNVRTSSDNDELCMRFSTDGGATFPASAGDYAYALYEMNETMATNSVASVGAVNLTNIPIMTWCGTGNGEWGWSSFNLYNRLTSSTVTVAAGFSGGMYGDGVEYAGLFFGRRRGSLENTDAVRFISGNGGNATFDYAIYGLM